MVKRAGVVVLLLMAGMLPVGVADALKPNRSAGGATDASLKHIRARALTFLRSAQDPNGSWTLEPTPPGFPAASDMLSDVPGGIGGLTAMVVYALVSAGVDAKDPALVRAAVWLRESQAAFRSDGFGATVARAMRVLAFVRVDPEKFNEQILEDARTIEAGVLPDGSWTHDLEDRKARRRSAKMLRKSGSRPQRGSVLMTNLAVQALWAAERHAGYEVGGNTWTRLNRRLRKIQRDDGTWALDIPTGGRINRASIAAALASYVLARARVPKALLKVRADEVAQSGSRAWQEESESNVGMSFVEYAFFSEHAATIAGWKDRDWYAPIARELASRQLSNGSWDWGFETRDRRGVRATAAALLCLTGASLRLLQAKSE